MTREEMLRELLTERFGTPTPPPAPLPHISRDALRELLDELSERDVA